MVLWHIRRLGCSSFRGRIWELLHGIRGCRPLWDWTDDSRCLECAAGEFEESVLREYRATQVLQTTRVAGASIIEEQRSRS